MSEDQSKRRLGRGLAALIGEMDRPAASREAAPGVTAPSADGRVPIEFVLPNPKNPRRSFGDEDLTDLAQSIKEHGIVQPVLVRRTRDGKFEIIAGERRWRAAQRAGLTEIPVLVRDVDDRTALELANKFLRVDRKTLGAGDFGRMGVAPRLVALEFIQNAAGR